MSSTHNSTFGLTVPGVGYLTFRVSGNELPVPTPPAAIIAPEANQGYVIIPTSLSLKDAYIKWLPSGEDHIASGSANISSARQKRDVIWMGKFSIQVYCCMFTRHMFTFVEMYIRFSTSFHLCFKIEFYVKKYRKARNSCSTSIRVHMCVKYKFALWMTA